MVSFTQVNLHKSKQATLLAGMGMAGRDHVVALLTEPHTIGGRLYGFPKGTQCIYDRTLTNTTPRAGIVASRDIPITTLDKWCNRDCAAGLVKINGKQTIIASIYLDINKPVRAAWLEALLKMAESRGYALIVGMDSNSHSDLMGGSSNNARGDDLEDLVLHHCLKVENVGNTPTFETWRGGNHIQTYIDITLSKDFIKPIQHWRVDRTYNGSDHNSIYYTIENENTAPVTVRPWSRANWGTFTEHLKLADYRLPEGISMKKLDRLIDRMYNVIQEGLDRACPQITIQPKIQKGHWVTEMHTNMKSKVSTLYKKAMKSGLDDDRLAYRKADKAFKRVCKRDKNRAWKAYKEGLQTEKEVTTLTKIAQRQEQRTINVLTRQDGTCTEPGSETIDLLTTTHFPSASGIKRVTYNNRKNTTMDHVRSKYKDWITPELTRKALLGFEKKKSPGPDGLKPLIFEHLPEQFIRVLTDAYKAAVHLGYTPKAWKKTKVIYISKNGKDRYDTPKAFRPISLSNYLLKGLERLVVWKMDQAVARYPLHHKQHGFQTGMSTESAISNATNYIERHIMRREHCVGVFLDISAAFDSIKPQHVRQALLKHGGDPELVQWYFGYMTHRDIEVELHGARAHFSTGTGLPQGGVCSAKFWLIAFDYAIQIINRYQIEGNGYADDCAALAGGKRIDSILRKLQKMLNELSTWGKNCGLHFNPDKSVAVLFTRRRKTPPFTLKLDGKDIEYKQEVKYLGVTLDAKLHWTKHINDRVSKSKRFLAHVAAITRNNWGPKPKLMRWAYLSVVRPMLCYGSMIWGHRAPALQAKLRRVNRMAINTFANFPKSTPTTALEVSLDVMPLHLFCLKEGILAALRLDRVLNLDWDGTNHLKTHSVSHLRHWRNKLDRLRINNDESDACYTRNDNPKYKINKESFDGKRRHRLHTQYNAYTDGSGIEGRAGAGFAIYRHQREEHTAHYRLPDHATVFQAELTAVRKACEQLQSISDLKYVKIFIDSQATIKALANPTVRSKTVEQAATALQNLASRARSVTVVWIPAHKGYIGNERADGLAKRGALTTDAQTALHTYIPAIHLKNKINKAAYDEWTTEWNAQNGVHHARSFYKGPDASKARFVYNLARLELGRFVRIISGHNNLHFFQTKLGLWSDPSCRFCGTGQETIRHLLDDCPCFLQEQSTFTATAAGEEEWSVRALLNFTYTPSINQAFEGTWLHSDPPDDGTNSTSAQYTTTDESD